MTATAHALVAGAIVQAFPAPGISVPLAFVSHFVMDFVPHWDFGTNWRDRPKKITGLLASAETILGITLAYFVFREKAPLVPLFATIIASELPDWLEAPWYMFFAHHTKHAPYQNAGFWEKLTYTIYRTENKFHSKTGLPWGILTQILTVSFFFILLRP